MTRRACLRATWRECRRETLRYRLAAARLAWRHREIVGPEVWWSM